MLNKYLTLKVQGHKFNIINTKNIKECQTLYHG